MTTVYKLADLVIDIEARRVTRENKTIRLPELSFGVLAALVSSAPDTLNVQDLAKKAWLSAHVSDETVAQRIKLLRKSLGDEVLEPKYIKTIRGAGYVCAQEVKKGWQNDAIGSGLSWIKKFRLPVVVIFICSILFIWFWQPIEKIEIESLQPQSLVDGLVDRALAQLEVQQADGTDRAIKLLRQAHALDVANSRVQIALSFALSTRATKFHAQPIDVYQAEELAREGLKFDALHANAWHALGYALDAQGRVDEALSCYERAYQLNEQDISAMSSAAYLLAIRGRLFDALVLESRAMKNRKSSRYAEIQLASVLDLIGHPEAEKWRTRAQILNPKQVVVIAEAAEAHLRRGQPAQALDALALAAEEFDTSPRLFHLTGRAYLSAGHTQKARVNLEMAGARASADLAALESLEGFTASANRQLKMVAQQMIAGDSWPRLRIQLAELYAALGDDKNALRLISQAVDLGWRDTLSIENSPFLADSIKHEDWLPIRQRIVREVSMQKSLIEQSAELSWIIDNHWSQSKGSG